MNKEIRSTQPKEPQTKSNASPHLKALIKAIELNNHQQAKNYLKKIKEPAQLNELVKYKNNSVTVLWLAIEKNMPELAEELIEKGADAAMLILKNPIII